MKGKSIIMLVIWIKKAQMLDKINKKKVNKIKDTK